MAFKDKNLEMVLDPNSSFYNGPEIAALYRVAASFVGPIEEVTWVTGDDLTIPQIIDERSSGEVVVKFSMNHVSGTVYFSEDEKGKVATVQWGEYNYPAAQDYFFKEA